MAERTTPESSPAPAGPAAEAVGAASPTGGEAGPTAGPTANPAAGPTAGPAGPTGGPATPPRVAPLAVLYTLGRLGIFVGLVVLLWLVRVPWLPALLFGVLLSMPASYFLLRPLRDRLTEALIARSAARRAAKERLRTRLAGDE